VFDAQIEFADHPVGSETLVNVDKIYVGHSKDAGVSV
jgi:hypothetical protein